MKILMKFHNLIKNLKQHLLDLLHITLKKIYQFNISLVLHKVYLLQVLIKYMILSLINQQLKLKV